MKQELFEEEIENITREELKEEIGIIKTGKVSGNDGIIYPEIIKYRNEEGKKELLNIFEEAWKEVEYQKNRTSFQTIYHNQRKQNKRNNKWSIEEELTEYL